jgi:hypothetical protein
VTHPGWPHRRGTQTTTAGAAAVVDRILLRSKAKFANVPEFLPPSLSGLVVDGRGAIDRAQQLRGPANQAQLPLLVDTAPYTGQDGIATVSRPLVLPGYDGVLPLDGFGAVDLDSLLKGQLAAGASAALVPVGYVPAGDLPTLRAVVAKAKTIERDDVIVVLPVDGVWLTRSENLPRLIAVLNKIDYPVLIMFGGQWNEVFNSSTGVVNFRRLLSETTRVGLGAGDMLAGFDCMAHGGLCAVIGSGGSLRHLVPADKRPTSSRPVAHYPSVLVPDLLLYLNADSLADTYAGLAPTCDCAVCGGRSLGRFHSRQDVVRQDAHAHNAAVWAALLEEFLLQPPQARQMWWQDRCLEALDAYDRENARIRARNALKPTPHLKRLAGGRRQPLAH